MIRSKKNRKRNPIAGKKNPLYLRLYSVNISTEVGNYWEMYYVDGKEFDLHVVQVRFNVTLEEHELHFEHMQLKLKAFEWDDLQLSLWTKDRDLEVVVEI